MPCTDCPNAVPVVSEALATKVVARLDPIRRFTATQAALEWLTTRHEGLELYQGINGRPYTNEEKDTIALETQAVASLPCPFARRDGARSCQLGGLGKAYNRVAETGKAPYGWLPTLVARLADREQFRSLVRVRAIADVKVALLSRNEGFLAKEESTY